MNPDDFENQLKSQPWRMVPSAWRREILGVARDPAALAATLIPTDSPYQWREWLWPHPIAWAGLAALWMVVLGLHWTQPDAQVQLRMASSSIPDQPTPAVQMALAEQRKLRDELLGLAEIREEELSPERSSDPAEARPRSALPSRWVYA
jgi:hypothetical protein